MPTAARSLNVIVVGAGLGGLSAALALQTDGHRVTVIDSAPEFAEVSASLFLVISQDSDSILIGWRRYPCAPKLKSASNPVGCGYGEDEKVHVQQVSLCSLEGR